MSAIEFPGEIGPPVRPRSQDPPSGETRSFAGVEKYGEVDADLTTIKNVLASSVIISGATNLDDWRKSGDLTKIDGGSVSANTITATQINVTNLAAINADLGSITAGSLDAVTITGTTITGGTFQTSTSGLRVVIDSNNKIKFHDSAGNLVMELWGTSIGMIVSNDIDMDNNDIVSVDTLVFKSGAGGLGSFDGNINIASGKDLVFLGTQGSINCGAINCDSINVTGDDITEVGSIIFNHNSSTPANRQFLMEDDGGTQRLRVKFANSGTQWQVDLTDACTPTEGLDVNPKYAKKYDLMNELKDSRFQHRWANTKEIQKEYRGQAKSHYPSMGNDGSEQQKHNEAMWKRPWIPMKTMPDRLETMGQYPYPFVESPLIGENEHKANFYQLIAHAYNRAMERIDTLEAQVTVLESV